MSNSMNIENPIILVADDNADTRYLIGLFLQKLPYDVRFCETASDALDVIEIFGSKMIAAFLDDHFVDGAIDMSFGGTLANAVRKKNAKTKIIALSSEDEGDSSFGDAADVTYIRKGQIGKLQEVVNQLAAKSFSDEAE
jgi:CheY-like chemotaxis protein